MTPRTTREAFTANRAAITAAETVEQVVARLCAQRRTETSIRTRAVGASVRAAGGSLAQEIAAVANEIERVKAEYAPLIAKHRPHVSWEGGTDEGFEAQRRGDYMTMQMGAGA